MTHGGQKVLTPLSAVCIGSFFATAAFQVVSPILSIYATETLGANVVDVGYLISAFSISASVTRLPLALVASRGRGRALLLASYASLCPIFVAQGLSPNVLDLILLRLLSGFFFAIIGPFSLALSTFAVSSGRRDYAVATYTSCVAIGLMAGPAIGTLSIASFGTRSTFFVASILAIAGFFFAIRGMRGVEVKRPGKISIRSSISSTISNRFFVMCFLALFCFAFQVTVAVAYAPLYAKQNFGMDDALVSAMFFAYSLVLVATRLSVRRLSKRIRRRAVLSIGLINSAIVLLALSFSPSAEIFFLLYSLLGISHGLAPPAAALIVAGSIDPGALVTANSIYFNSYDLGAMIGPSIMASVVESSGIAQALVLSSVIPLMGILAIVALSGARWKEMLRPPARVG